MLYLSCFFSVMWWTGSSWNLEVDEILWQKSIHDLKKDQRGEKKKETKGMNLNSKTGFWSVMPCTVCTPFGKLMRLPRCKLMEKKRLYFTSQYHLCFIWAAGCVCVFFFLWRMLHWRKKLKITGNNLQILMASVEIWGDQGHGGRISFPSSSSVTVTDHLAKEFLYLWSWCEEQLTSKHFVYKVVLSNTLATSYMWLLGTGNGG